MQQSLDFWKESSIECLENRIWVELRENVKHKIDCKITVYVPCEKVTLKHYGGMWDLSKKTEKSETKISKAALSELFQMG